MFSPYARYLMILLVPIAFCTSVVVGLAHWAEPTANDLTRLGAYPERDYGWRSVQRQFVPPLAAYGTPEQTYDVVVVGDSFSIDGRTGLKQPRMIDRGFWTDWFVQRTGLQVGTFHRDQVDTIAYLGSAASLANPPKLVVVEYVERVLAGKRAPTPGCAPAGTGARFRPQFRNDFRPVPTQPVAYEREPLRALPITRIDEAIDFLLKNVPRWLLALDLTKTVRVPLSRPDLFSSRKSSDLIVYVDDLRKPALTEETVHNVACFLRDVQAQIERTGQTSVVFMIAPDKAVAYQAFAPDLPAYSLTEALARDQGLPLLRVDRAIQQAIAAGTQDVYIPGDTHWGEAGKQIAADTLIRYLRPEP